MQKTEDALRFQMSPPPIKQNQEEHIFLPTWENQMKQDTNPGLQMSHQIQEPNERVHVTPNWSIPTSPIDLLLMGVPLVGNIHPSLPLSPTITDQEFEHKNVHVTPPLIMKPIIQMQQETNPGLQMSHQIQEPNQRVHVRLNWSLPTSPIDLLLMGVPLVGNIHPSLPLSPTITGAIQEFEHKNAHVTPPLMMEPIIQMQQDTNPGLQMSQLPFHPTEKPQEQTPTISGAHGNPNRHRKGYQWFIGPIRCLGTPRNLPCGVCTNMTTKKRYGVPLCGTCRRLYDKQKNDNIIKCEKHEPEDFKRMIQAKNRKVKVCPKCRFLQSKKLLLAELNK